jgi:hypothetical protein
MEKCERCENEFEQEQLKVYEKKDNYNHYICLGCAKDGEYGHCELCGDEKIHDLDTLTHIDDSTELSKIYSQLGIDSIDYDGENVDVYLCPVHYDEITTEIGVDDAEFDMFPNYDEDEKEEYYQSLIDD